MPHLFYFSTGQGPWTHPSGFSPEEKAVEYEPHGLARLGGNVPSLTNRIVSSQSQSQGLQSHFEGGWVYRLAIYRSRFSGNSVLNASNELAGMTR